MDSSQEDKEHGILFIIWRGVNCRSHCIRVGYFGLIVCVERYIHCHLGLKILDAVGTLNFGESNQVLHETGVEHRAHVVLEWCVVSTEIMSSF